MATLNPLGLLILYIALAAAPQPADQLAISFDGSVEMILIEQDDGWWVRDDNSGLTTAYKREGTKLMVRHGEDQQEIDISEHFKITGKEDFSASMVIQPQSRTGLDPVETAPGKDGILLKTGSKGKRLEASIEWTIPD